MAYTVSDLTDSKISTLLGIRRIHPNKEKNSFRKKAIPVRLNSFDDRKTLTVNIKSFSFYNRKLIFRDLAKDCDILCRGSDSNLGKILISGGESISNILLSVLEIHCGEALLQGALKLDLEKLSEDFYKALNFFVLSDVPSCKEVSYENLASEDRQILREFIVYAVEHHNKVNGLNITLYNTKSYKLEKIELAQKKLIKTLKGLADGSSEFPEHDTDKAPEIVSTFRALQVEKDKILSFVPPLFRPIESIRYETVDGVDRYGYKNCEGRKEKYGLYDLMLDPGKYPVMDNDLKVQLQDILLTDEISLEDKIKWGYIDGLGYIPLLPGVMRAENSTSTFVNLIINEAQNLKDKLVYQIGPSHGGITKKLAESAGEVVAVDILPEAIKNTKLTLRILPEEKRRNVMLINDDLSYLVEHSKKTGRKAKYLFFNCPIFKGSGNHNSMAGDDFDLIKRTIKILPDVLDEDGKAYLLVGYPRSEQGRKRLWTLDKLRHFLLAELPEYSYNDSDYCRSYESRYSEHGTYGIVEIFKKPHKDS